MAESPSKRINREIENCLALCYENPMPLGVLAGCLSKLAADPVWNSAEIEQVESGVLQLLVALSGRSAEPQLDNRV